MLEIIDLVNEAKATIGDAACSAGFRDLAIMDRLRQGGGSSAKIRAEGHEVVEAWVPRAPSLHQASTVAVRCAISSTLRLSGYPWPNVLETTLAWVRHHSALGFSPIILFLDEPDESKEESLAACLRDDASIQLVRDSEMRAAWPQHGALWDEFGRQTDSELSAMLV